MLEKFIKKAKLKLSKEKAHFCENWGQNELRQARDLIDYNNYSASINLINEFENWIEEQGV